jgi:hypothetical protein
VLVTLTPAGKKRALEVFSAKTDTWHAPLSALSPARQRRLNDDLRTVLLALEGPAQPALRPLRILPRGPAAAQSPRAAHLDRPVVVVHLQRRRMLTSFRPTLRAALPPRAPRRSPSY